MHSLRLQYFKKQDTEAKESFSYQLCQIQDRLLDQEPPLMRTLLIEFAAYCSSVPPVHLLVAEKVTCAVDI